MKTKMVKHTLNTLPPLTEVRRAKLRALGARPDSEIDFSDIPEMTDEQWKNAERGHFYRPVKRQITARVDADVLAYQRDLAAGDAGGASNDGEVRLKITTTRYGKRVTEI